MTASGSSASSAQVRAYSGSTKVRNLILLILLAILALIGWHWISGGASAGKDKRGNQPIAVGVASVNRQDVPLQLSALGTVTAAKTVTVHSRVDGQLEKLHFKEGDLVKEGQLLAELDPRPFQAVVTEQEGQLQRDQALLTNAKRDLERYLKLLPQNLVAKQQVDTQESLVQQYQGTVHLDQGLLDNARVQLEYSRIKAPTSGRVGLLQIDQGNIVHSSDSAGLVVITQTDPINVLFSVPEANLMSVLEAYQSNQALPVSARDRDDRKVLAKGYLLAIDNQLNTSTGTVNLKASFDNQAQRLFPNQFVNVHLELGVRTQAVTVPTAAIQMGQPGHYVYTVQPDQTVKLTPVQVGPSSGELTIIEQGVQPGQQVVVQGLDKLRNQSKIRLIQIDTHQDASAHPARSNEARSASLNASPAKNPTKQG